MKIGVLGSGNVGQALAKGFLGEGHEVYLATREPDGDKAAQLKQDLQSITVCDFETAAKNGEMVVLCTPWNAAEDAVERGGKDNLAGKVVIDTNNALKRGESGVSLAITGEDSAGETVQRWLPDSLVVKCFNSVGADLMYKPSFDVAPTMFIAGNDAGTKQQVSQVVESFGWEVLDTGDITASRQLESLAVIWINNSMSTGGRAHAFKML